MLRIVSLFFLLNFLLMQPSRAQLPDFTEMVKTNGAAVVNISTVQKAKPDSDNTVSPQLPEGIPPEMEDFFRRFYNLPDGDGYEARETQ